MLPFLYTGVAQAAVESQSTQVWRRGTHGMFAVGMATGGGMVLSL